MIRLPAPALIERYRSMGLWPEETLLQELDAGLRRHPRQRFKIWSLERPYEGTFGDVRERALRLATAFRQKGIGPGDVVSFQLPNWIEAVQTFLATLYVGAISLPIVQIYGAKELRFVLAQTQAKLHVTTTRYRSLAYRELIEAMRPELPALRHVMYVDGDFESLSSLPAFEGTVTVHPDSPAVIGYTSGTTADPKGVIHTHRTTVAEMWQRRVREPGDNRSPPITPPPGFERWLVGAPIGHVAGLQLAIYVPVMFDRPAHVMDRWDIEAVLEALVSEDLSLAAAPNFFFSSVLNHQGFKPEVHLHHLKYIFSGGAPVPTSFGERCHAAGINLVRGYGSTEHPSVCGSAFEDPLEKRIGTDGRALSGVEIQIRDAHGRVLPRGSAGAIHSRGPDLFVGYVDAALNEAAFDAEGWFDSGDIGVLDEDGFLTITDRIKDIIIRGGENISAAEVEDAISRMAAVAEVAAVSAPDERMGEHVCAFIMTRAGAMPPSMADLREHLSAAGLARQKWPEEIRIVQEFERTAAGKIKKYLLRELLRRESRHS